MMLLKTRTHTRQLVLATLVELFFAGTAAPTHAEADRKRGELEGLFWVGNLESDSASELGLIEIKATPDGHYDVIQYSDDGDSQSIIDIEGAHASLRMTGIDGIYLLNVPNSWLEENKSPFNIMAYRSTRGTFRFHFVSTDLEEQSGMLDSPIEGAGASYLEGIMRRHLAAGMTLDLIDAETQLKIFSDPDFLGGLHVEQDNQGTLYPAQLAAPPEPEGEDVLSGRTWESALVVKGFAISTADVAQPEDFAGRYVETGGHTQIFADPVDGSFHIVKYGQYGGEAQKIKLLPLAVPNSFLGLVIQSEDECDANGTARDCHEVEWFSPSMVSIAENGDVTITTINLAANNQSPVLDSFAMQIRENATRRHGFRMSDYVLEGQLTAAGLLAVLTDPQFQAGLVLDSMPRTLKRVKGSE